MIMNVRRVFLILFGTIISFNILVLFLLFNLLDNQRQHHESQVNRFNSFTFSDDLRESSDDLTAYARNFVITGDSTWEKRYWDIVYEHEGELISETYRQSVLDSMSRMGFVEEEFELLKTALDYSNQLVEVEREAMNAAKGLFLDEQGEYTIEGPPNVEYAIDLLYNDEYVWFQDQIMDPIDQFEVLIEKRTKNATEESLSGESRLLVAITSMKIFVIVFSIIAMILVWRRIKKEEEISEKLERSELQFKTLVNNLPGVIYNCGLEDPWEMFFITDEIETLSGYPKEEFQGTNPKRTFGDIMHPDDRESASKQVQKAINSKKPFQIEYRVIDKDGNTHNVYGYGQAMYRGNGSPDYLVGGIFDDSERLTAVNKVKASEERFQLAAKGSNAGIWDLNVESGLAYWTDIHYELLGYKVNEITPSLSFLREHVLMEDIETFDEAVNDHISKGAPLDFEARIYTKNKDIRWFRVRGAASRDDDGKAIRIVGTFSDITEKKVVENALAAKEQQLQYALDVSNEGIWEWNHDTNKITYSLRCFSMIGYLPVEEEKLPGFWNMVIHKDDAIKALMNDIENIKSSGLHDHIYRAISKSGEVKWIHTKGKAVEFLANGKPARVIGTMSDITDRMKHEEKVVSAILETEDKERSRIARDIHDGLQQTMSTALMSFEKVRSSIDFKDQKIYDRFHQGYQYLKKSIEESRTLAHNLMPKVVDKNGIVAAIDSLISAMKNSTDTNFVFEQNMNKERLKLSEEMTFYRIVQEAINNVIKYANANKCTIQLLKHSDLVILTIEDDGSGFDFKKISNTFGINSMKTRADSIGAYFELNSRVGKGTQIMLELGIS